MINPTYGGMFGNIPPALLPNGQESLSGMRQLMHVAAAYGRSVSPGISKSVVGSFEIPADRLIIYGKIWGDDSSSSDSSSSDQQYYFYDNDGYLAHAFDEINPFHPWKGEVMEGGVSTILPDESSSSSGEVFGGGNFAYTLNGESLNPGTLVALFRAGEHWIVVGVGGSGAQSACFEIDCAAGTITVIPCGTSSSTTGSTGSNSSTSSSTNTDPVAKDNVGKVTAVDTPTP